MKYCDISIINRLLLKNKWQLRKLNLLKRLNIHIDAALGHSSKIIKCEFFFLTEILRFTVYEIIQIDIYTYLRMMHPPLHMRAIPP